MKELMNDIKAEGYTKKDYIVYGIVAPILMTAAIIIISAI